jgi:hypothetical protein
MDPLTRQYGPILPQPTEEGGASLIPEPTIPSSPPTSDYYPFPTPPNYHPDDEE